MRKQDIQALKDSLLIEVSQLLGVDLHTSEALLRVKNWDKETLLSAWLDDKDAILTEAGVNCKGFLSSRTTTGQGGEAKVEKEQDDDGDSPPGLRPIPPLMKLLRQSSKREEECGICGDEPDAGEPPLRENVCGHAFCVECWQGYIYAHRFLLLTP